MVATVVGVASGAGASLALPAHVAGDLLIIFAYRYQNTTPPTVPAGWTAAAPGTGGQSNSSVVGYKVAASNAEASDTWTNATWLVAVVIRGHGGIGAVAGDGQNSTTPSFPALTLAGSAGTSLIIRLLGHRLSTTASTPANHTLQHTGGAGPPVLKAFSAPGSEAAAASGTSDVASGWRSWSIEILPAASAVDLDLSDLTTGAPVLGDMTLSQAHSLGLSSLATGAAVPGDMALQQAQQLGLADLAAGAAELPSLALQQAHILDLPGLSAGAPVLGDMALSGVGDLDLPDLTTGAAELGGMALSQAHLLPLPGLSAEPVQIGPITLVQVHQLALSGLSAGAATPGQMVLSDEAPGSGAVYEFDAVYPAPLFEAVYPAIPLIPVRWRAAG